MYLELKIAIIRSGKPGYEIAKALSWHPTKLSQVINGIHTPNDKEKRQLANYLGKAVHELFTNSPLEVA